MVDMPFNNKNKQTIVGYLMLNPLYTYILNIYIYIYIWLVNIKNKINGPKYCYVSQINQLNINHLFTLLNGQTVQFLTSQFIVSHLSILSLNVKQFCLIYR